MPKLQKIKRPNGSVVSSINIPIEIIEALGWVKGAELTVTLYGVNDSKIIIYKDGGDG